MEIDLKTLQPRHEFNRLVLNAKSLTINGYSGPVTVVDDGLGGVTVAWTEEPPTDLPKPKAKRGRK